MIGRPRDEPARPPRGPEAARESGEKVGLGRLLDLDSPAGTAAHEAGAPSVALVRRRAVRARERGDRWFSCVVREPAGGPDDEAREGAGSVVTAVEDAGWRLRRLDHLWLGAEQDAVAVCCTFSAPPDPADPRALGRHARLDDLH